MNTFAKALVLCCLAVAAAQAADEQLPAGVEDRAVHPLEPPLVGVYGELDVADVEAQRSQAQVHGLQSRELGAEEAGHRPPEGKGQHQTVEQGRHAHLAQIEP